jgi:uncharacterized protein YqgC (DUF456 family)
LENVWIAWGVRILLYLLLLVALVLVPLGLSGTFVMVGLVLLYALLVGFKGVGLGFVAILLGLAVLGEVIEAVLGTVYVARRGATRYGVAGSFLGGIVGAVIGSGWFPLVGTLAGGFVGAFLGALGGEYLYYERLDRALPTGFAAFVGKVLASSAKMVLAVGILILAVWKTLP